MKIVEIKDVSLRTMSVEIRSMTVSGKQMTMSVFRQLPPRYCFDRDTLKILADELWGHVNYFWGGDYGKLHVVFAKNGVLCRDPIWNYELNSKNAVRESREFSDSSRALRSELEWATSALINIASSPVVFSDHDRREQSAKTRFSEAVAKWQEAEAAHNEILEDAKKRDADEEALLNALRALPQLFIAV